MGIGVAAVLGFGGTWLILQVMKRTIGIRVDPEVEDIGLDLAEHGEAAYADEEEFRLTPDDYLKKQAQEK